METRRGRARITIFFLDSSLTLVDWGAISAIVLLCVTLIGTGIALFNYLLRKNPIKLCGYYCLPNDKIVEVDEFYSKFRETSANKGDIELRKGRGSIYFETEPRIDYVRLTEVSCRFKGKRIGKPRLVDKRDLTYPFGLQDVKDLEGITFEYQGERSLYKQKKYYYAYVYDAPSIWIGEVSFMFCINDLGRCPVRKNCKVIEKG